MAVNDGISRPMAAEIIPGVPSPRTTGAAAGSQGPTAGESAPPLADVQVSIPFASSQPAIPVATVSIGDTDSFSSDQPYQHGREPVTGVALDYGGAAGGAAPGPRPPGPQPHPHPPPDLPGRPPPRRAASTRP